MLLGYNSSSEVVTECLYPDDDSKVLMTGFYFIIIVYFCLTKGNEEISVN